MYAVFAKLEQLYKTASASWCILLVLGVLVMLYGNYLAFFDTPPDYQQMDAVVIMFVHVPAAWLASLTYALMGVLSLCYLLAGRNPFPALLVRAMAPVGCVFTVVCLLTGALWGKPMWGTFWVWDARLTSVFFLFLSYLGFMILSETLAHTDRKHVILSWLVLVTSVNLPIIKFSVEWWNTLHQPSGIFQPDMVHIDYKIPLIVMFVGMLLVHKAIVMIRMRTFFVNMQRVRSGL